MDFERLCLKCLRESLENGICISCGTRKGFSQEPIFALPPGTILHGRYLTGTVLGHGGFGITYMGLDLKANERVAIKEFMPDGLSTRVPGRTIISVHSNSEEYYYGRNQFLEEARIIYKYRSNPNIISVSALFEENNTAYYVMEYLEGCDLKQYLAKNGGTISYIEAMRLLSPVFDALSTIHKHNVIHRDISPDNIYICRNGQAKLLDFGAARVALMGKSKSLSIILKRGYAPEEQYRSHGVQGPWTDIYALSATLYKCITGQIPLEATERLHKDELVPPSKLCGSIPFSAERAILKALSINAGQRYKTMEEFKSALNDTPRDMAKNQYASPKAPSPASYSPQRAEPPVLGRRIAAYIIDGIILYLLQLLLLRLFTVTVQDYFTMVFLCTFIYGSCFEASGIKGTIGKAFMGLKVTDKYGCRLGAGKAFIRNFIKYWPSLFLLTMSYYTCIIIVVINYGTALFSSEHRTLHDMLSGSLVMVKHVSYKRAYENNQDVKPQQKEKAQQEEKSAQSAFIQSVSGHYAGNEFPIQKTVTMGRNPKLCNIIFPDDIRGVSSIHCELSFDENLGGVTIKDLGSTYGTITGNKKLYKGDDAVLYDGDGFTIGENNSFTVHIAKAL